MARLSNSRFRPITNPARPSSSRKNCVCSVAKIAMRYCRPDSCAGAACGHNAAAPPISAMNSRRLIIDPKISRHVIATKPTTWIVPNRHRIGSTNVWLGSQGDLADPRDIGPPSLRKRTCRRSPCMSAMGQKATLAPSDLRVAPVPTVQCERRCPRQDDAELGELAVFGFDVN